MYLRLLARRRPRSVPAGPGRAPLRASGSPAEGLLPFVVLLERRVQGRLSRQRSVRGAAASPACHATSTARRCEALLRWLRAMRPRGSAAQRTAGELPLWHLAGRLYGRFPARTIRPVAPWARPAPDRRPPHPTPMTPSHRISPPLSRSSSARSTDRRCSPDALTALVRQMDAPPYEVVVVDNNSTDDTRAVVASFAAAGDIVRYVLEPAQGLSHARNRGVAATSADIVAFTDDDVRVDCRRGSARSRGRSPSIPTSTWSAAGSSQNGRPSRRRGCSTPATRRSRWSTTAPSRSASRRPRRAA